MTQETPKKKLTLEDIYALERVRREEEERKNKLIESEHEDVRETIKFLREPISKHQANRHIAEVNFTQFTEKHWQNLQRHSLVSKLFGGFSLDPLSNQMSVAKIKEATDVIQQVIADEDAYTSVMLVRLENTDKERFRSRPWTEIYKFMVVQNFSMIMCMILHSYWKQLSLEYHQYRSNLNAEKMRFNDIAHMDPLGISNEIRRLIVELNRLKKLHEPIEIQFNKYKDKLDESNMQIARAESELHQLKTQLDTLSETQRQTTLDRVTRQRGRQIDLGELKL